MREKTMQHHRIRGITLLLLRNAGDFNGRPANKSCRKYCKIVNSMVGNFAVNTPSVRFDCSSCRGVIELDDDVHDRQVEYDKARTEQLNPLGYRVIGFRDPDVMDHLD